MKHTFTILATLFTCTLWAQENVNPQQQNPPPQQVQQQQYQNPEVNLDNNPVNDKNVERNVNFQTNVENQVDWDGGNKNDSKQENDPCPDCDKIKKAKKENYGNNYAGNYNGGAKKFKRKKNWKRFCYNISHRTGKKKAKTNYSLCFNW